MPQLPPKISDFPNKCDICHKEFNPKDLIAIRIDAEEVEIRCDDCHFTREQET